MVFSLTLYLLIWRIWWAPNNASKGQMGFNLAFRGLSSSSVPRSTTLAPSVGAPLAPNFKCFRIATIAPCFIGKKLVHEDLRLSFFIDHIKSLTETFGPTLADVGNPLFIELGRYWSWQRVDPDHLKQVQCDRQHVLATLKKRPCRHIIRAHLALFDYPDWVLFRVFFFSCKANARV